jgi:hypothetical protein
LPGIAGTAGTALFAAEAADVVALEAIDVADDAIVFADDVAAPIAEFAPDAMSVDAEAAAAAGSTGGVTGSILESFAPPPQAAARAKGAKTKYLSMRIVVNLRARVITLKNPGAQRKNDMYAIIARKYVEHVNFMRCCICAQGVPTYDT